MNIINTPPALVLGCNTPHGINVLSDWIEEQTGYKPDFFDSGWTDGRLNDNGNGIGNGNNDEYGYNSRIGNNVRSEYFTDGSGCYYLTGEGYGYGYGNGIRRNYGSISGNGLGDGDGYGYATGNGCGCGLTSNFYN